MNLQLKKFDMAHIKDDSVIVFIGRRNTGKSFLVKDFLFHHKDFPIGTIISGTEAASGYYGKFNPSLFIHHEFTSELVANVHKRQNIVIDEQKKEIKNRIPYDFDWKDRNKEGPRNNDISYDIVRKECWISRTEYQLHVSKVNMIKEERDGQYLVSWKNENIPANIDARAFLLLDDCLYDNAWTKDINIRAFFLNGRHKDLMLLITMQYVMGIPPLLRTNIDYVFILREPYMQNRRRIYENFAGVFPTLDVFCQIMDQCTENFECLVIHTNSKSNKLEDQVFWYKADNHMDFKIGADEYWKYHNENCTDQMISNNDKDENINNVNQNKKGPKIHVKKAY
jgi:hypothetical protein